MNNEIKDKEIKELAFLLVNEIIKESTAQETAEKLYNAGYRKQNDTVKEFAEKLNNELFAKCVVIQTISNPQTEDMNSSEAFQIIKELAEQYGKE